MSRWIEDPQGREEVEKVTRFLKLPIWKPQYLGKFREFWNELWEKIDTNAETSALTLSGKEDSFSKNSAFNKDFGVARDQVLEGAKLAEILGVPYGGLLNNNTTKKRGLGYYCTVNESIYKCLEDTQLNYAESNYFDAISNDDLLGKLQNLTIFKKYILSPSLSNYTDNTAQPGDVYLATATSGGEKEIFDSKIIIIPSSRLITSCKMDIFQGTINVTYDGIMWRWNREGAGSQGEIKVYKLQLFL